MRDDNNARHFPPNDPYRRQQTTGATSAQDPLAELARLIGQNDPLSDFARDQRQQTPPAFEPRRDDSPGWTPPRAPSHHDPRQGRAPEPQHHPYAPQNAPAPHDYRAAPEEHHFSDPFGEPPLQEPQYQPRDDRHYAQRGQAAPRAPSGGQQFEPNFDGQPFGQQFDRQQYADPRFAAQGYGDAQAYNEPQHAYPPQQAYQQHNAYPEQHAYAQQDAFASAQGQQGYGSDPYYRGMPHDEDMYEDQPRAPRRGGLLTVMAVLALAVVGTAAAFGYRTLFSGSGSAVTPPTIKADAGPNKVAPAPQGGDASGKAIYDRVGDKGQPERVISREEQPVDIKSAPPPPRVVLSNPTAPASGNPLVASPPSAPTTSASTGNASTEPKKIRTVTIRPDQPAADSVASTPVARQASAAAEQAIPPASTTVRTTTIRQQPAAAAPAESSAPLSIAPNNSQRGGTRVASAPATRPMTTSSGDSAFAVQVTSQRTEAEAQSSYQALQAKYPSVLGSRQAVIRRADLGDKGTYYRAQVPFGSQGEASEFCASLKAAGGQCVVQRN